MAHHHFQPQRYYTSLGMHPPALRLAPGDTVSTTTVDARGKDASNQVVTERGNPMTGPFYIEGAEPGDTLIVTLDRLYPNRSQGWTSTGIAPHVLEPGFDLALAAPAPLGEWEVDLAAGTARMVQPATVLSAVALPLEPMLGCLGVAPPGGQVISTATSSTHGGNMDYRGFVQGVKISFPVFVPGALFFLGDGHALQGDGEITGTGIEISFEVTFTVALAKGKKIGWPRAENRDYLMTVGNARPLDQCVQHATTEMVRWLQTDLGLDARAAQVLLGQGVRYDLGNIFDPAYTMVCKVPKALLAKMGVIQEQ